MTPTRWGMPAIHRDRVVPPLLAFAAFLAGWQLLVIVGSYPAYILPGPRAVGERFLVAANHHGQDALLSARLPARHRRI